MRSGPSRPQARPRRDLPLGRAEPQPETPARTSFGTLVPDRACWGPSPGPGETIHQRAFTTSRIVELFVRDQGIDLEYQLVDLFTGAHKHPDFEKLNPNRLAPVLEDGDFFLTESSAIVKYIAEKCGSAAYPKNLQARTQVNEMMDWFNANFYKDFGYGFIYPQLYPPITIVPLMLNRLVLFRGGSKKLCIG